MNPLDQELFINSFEERLYGFLKEYIVIPRNPVSEGVKKVTTFKEFTDEMKVFLENIGSDTIEKIGTIEKIYNFLYVNKEHTYAKPKFMDTIKSKLIENYFSDKLNVYMKYYVQNISKMYYKTLFGNNFDNYVTDLYLNNKFVSGVNYSEIKNYIFSKKSKENNGFLKKDTFLTYVQAYDLHQKIIAKMKEKIMNNNKDEFLKNVISDIYCFLGSDLSDEAGLNLSSLEKKMKFFEESYNDEYKKFCESDTSKEIKIMLYSKLCDKTREQVKNLYKVIYNAEFLEYNIDLFKYFLVNRQKYEDSVNKSVIQHIYNYCIDKANKEYLLDDKRDTVTQIKLQIYINYYYGDMDENNKNMYREYCEAIFDKPFEFNYQMAVLYAASLHENFDKKNSMGNNYDTVSNSDKFKNLIIETMLN